MEKLSILLLKTEKAIKLNQFWNWIFFRFFHRNIEDDIIARILNDRAGKVKIYTLYKQINSCFTQAPCVENGKMLKQLSLLTAKALIEIDQNSLDSEHKKKIELENYINNIEALRFNYRKWEKYYHLLISNGLLYAGMLVRKKMEFIVEGMRGTSSDMQLLGLYLEKGEYSNASMLLDDSKYIKNYKLLRHSDLSYIEYLCHILSRKFQIKKGAFRRIKYDDNDEKFYNYINGKEVYIIAHANNVTICDEVRKIPKDAIIMFISWFPDDIYINIAEDRRPEIVFYNYEGRGVIRKIQDKSFLDSVKFIISKAESKDRVADFGSVRLNSKTRISFPKKMSNYMTFAGILGQVQLILADLVCFGAKIHVMNANLYYADKEYMDGNYSVQEEYDYFKRMEGFYSHDLIANFRFTKSLYENGFFEADEMLKKVLSMSLEEYVRGIEDMHLKKYIRGRK